MGEAKRRGTYEQRKALATKQKLIKYQPIIGNAHKVNWSKRFDGVRIKVMCPTCGAEGAHYLYTYQPKCHVCIDTILMLPASNNQCECSWEEAQEYFLKLKESK